MPSGPPDFKQRTFTERQWYWFIALMGLLTRVPLLRLSLGETTDGILSLTYFSPDRVPTPRFVILPGFPLLLRALGDDPLAGRCLAAMAGLLFLVPLWKFARRWLSVEMTGITCLMALFSPLHWEWSLKVMGDTLFLLFFWWSLERLASFAAGNRPSAWWWGALAGALAALTRAEGFLLLPWVLALGLRPVLKDRPARWFGLVVIWSAPVYFLAEKLGPLLFAYREGLGLTGGDAQVRFPFLNFVDHLYAYLAQPVFVFTPLVFWFAVLGLAKMARRPGPEGEAFKRVVLQVYVLLFLSRLVPTTYQDRHMLPFLPLLLVAAGYHLETFFDHWGKARSALRVLVWKNGVLTLTLVWLALFSSAVLISQSDSFGDIKRSSESLRELPPGAVIYSDEVPKTQYWSGRKVNPIVLPFHPVPGDFVVIHSFYTPRLSYVDENLRNRWGAVQIRGDRSMVVPLLTDVMEDPALQNRIKAAAFRFEPQFFSSLVYRIEKRPAEQEKP